jgi:hypothetical protein
MFAPRIIQQAISRRREASLAQCATTLCRGGRCFVVEPVKAEIAFTLIDEYQAVRIFESVLTQDLSALGEASLREIVAEVLSENVLTLSVL